MTARPPKKPPAHKMHYWQKKYRKRRKYNRTKDKRASQYMKLRPFTRLDYAAIYIEKLENHLVMQDDALGHLRKLIAMLEKGDAERTQREMDKCRHLLRRRKKRSVYSPDFKFAVLQVMQDVPRGKQGRALKKLGVALTTWQKWKETYEDRGIDGLAGYDREMPPPRPVLAAQLSYNELRDVKNRERAEAELRSKLQNRKTRKTLRNPEVKAHEAMKAMQEAAKTEGPVEPEEKLELDQEERKWQELF